MAEQRKNLLKFLLKLSVSGALLAFVFTKVDTTKLAESFRAVSLETVILLSTLYLAGQLVSALKWRVLVTAVGITRPLFTTIRAYIFGMFVNSFAFGTVGGDLARAVALRPGKGERTVIFATVFADRVHGLGVLLGIGALSILAVQPPSLPFWAGGASGLAIAGIALFWWLGPKILQRLFPPGHRFHQPQITKAFPQSWDTFLPVTLLSVIFHLSQIFMFFIITQELSLPLPLAYLLCVMPVVNILATLPLSIQGLGVREALLTYFFSFYSVGHEQAVTCGAIWFLIVTVVSALCGVVFTPDLIRSGETILKDTEPAEIIQFTGKKQQRG